MMMGHHDRSGYVNMYSGPANGGVCPLTNSVWGYGECPLSATHMGYDDLATRGHVDDYWVSFGDAGPDPYIVNGWPEHAHADCTADFMGTNQSKYGLTDGATLFYFWGNGDPLYDYTGCEPGSRDGCHGLRLFVESRSYTVTSNYNQYIYPYAGNTHGFTYQQFQSEIEAGRPVMIQVSGHSMVGYGYDTVGNVVYVHDTWDHDDHQMTWGGSYAGMQHYGVTALHVEGITLGISVTPATFGFGFVDSGVTATNAGHPLVVQNTGNVPLDIGARIRDEDDREEWTAGGTAGANVYVLSTRLEETIGTFGPDDILTTLVQWCNATLFGGGGCNMTPGTTLNQWFQFRAPTSVSGTHARDEHGIVVEVSCKAHE
jgi:hypothetical protein